MATLLYHEAQEPHICGVKVCGFLRKWRFGVGYNFSVILGEKARARATATHLSAPPVTVKVLPDPVCPYAKTVEL